jgi:2,4-dienoyl-CoA reductase-like NADH-dependent reductase (Old Yellow Enzyme family)
LNNGDEAKMVELFEATKINTLTLANRFVRSATCAYMADDDGSVTPKLIDLMVKLAKGGVGLIITGLADVRRDGQAAPWQLGIYSDELIPSLTEMAEAVHEAGGKIAVQIAHTGLQAHPRFEGAELLGPSAIRGEGIPVCREMTQGDIGEVVYAFGQAADRAKKAGFDGVQIHAAHGYLLSEFLSPFFNKRTDDYGGSVKNRARIVLESYRSVRNAVGNQFPVMIKMNSEDLLDGGFSVEDMLEVAGMLEEAGIDAIELSAGTTLAYFWGNPNASYVRMGKKEVYWLEAAKRYKEKIGVPLMLVGGIRSYEVAEKLVQEGIADYISLSRPLIREPNLINRWKSGDTRKAECISDNACVGPALEGEGIRCVHISGN